MNFCACYCADGRNIRNGSDSGLKIGSGPYRRFVPQAAVSSRSKVTPLFDHLVGNGEYAGRHLDVQSPRRLQVENELEFG